MPSQLDRTTVSQVSREERRIGAGRNLLAGLSLGILSIAAWANPNANVGLSTLTYLRGNPTDASTGTKSLEESDIGDAVLSFRRHYNSDPSKEGGGIFGAGWRGDFDRSVVKVGGSDTVVYRPDGTVLNFTLVSGVWTPDADVNDRLVEMTDGSGNVLGWTVFVAADNSHETYDATGRLTAIHPLDGQLLQLSYSTSATPSNIAPAPGLLLQVNNQFGDALHFVYDANSEVITLTDAAGNAYHYSYDGSRRLTGVTSPDTATRSYLYSEPANTGGASLPNAPTGINVSARSAGLSVTTPATLIQITDNNGNPVTSLYTAETVPALCGSPPYGPCNYVVKQTYGAKQNVRTDVNGTNNFLAPGYSTFGKSTYATSAVYGQ